MKVFENSATYTYSATECSAILSMSLYKHTSSKAEECHWAVDVPLVLFVPLSCSASSCSSRHTQTAEQSRHSEVLMLGSRHCHWLHCDRAFLPVSLSLVSITLDKVLLATPSLFNMNEPQNVSIQQMRIPFYSTHGSEHTRTHTHTHWSVTMIKGINWLITGHSLQMNSKTFPNHPSW